MFDVTLRNKQFAEITKMTDSRDSVYRHYLMKRYWEQKTDYDLSKIIPYEDAHLDLEVNPYNNPRESKTQVNDVAVERLIDRILTNQAISMAEGKDYYEDFESNPLGYEADKIPGMYKIQSNSFSDSRLPKKRSGSKPIRRSRSRKPTDEDDRYNDLPEGSEVSNMDSLPTVTLSIDMLRRYMYIEVEARVRYINEYYARQWDEINKEKLASYAELIILKDSNETFRAELAEMETVMLYYKKLCGLLEGKVETAKEAKRRRRQAKKQRKSDTPSASQSDTVSCTHVQSPQETANNDGIEKPEVIESNDDFKATAREENPESSEENEESNESEIDMLEKEHAEIIHRFNGDITDEKANRQECVEGEVDMAELAFDKMQKATDETIEMLEEECDKNRQEAASNDASLKN